MTSDEDARVRAGSRMGPVAAAPLPPPPGSGYPPPRRSPDRRWVIAALVALLLAAGTLTVVLVARHSNRTATPAPPASQVTTSAAPTPTATGSGPTASASVSITPSAPASVSVSPAQPVLLPHGQEAPASAIRWNQVDAGWSLHAWAADSNANGATASTLYLINPIGGRYRIATLLPNTVLTAWSPDRRRAIVVTYRSDGARVFQELALRTGTRLSSFVLVKGGLLGYAGPGGHSLLLESGGVGDEPNVLERVSTAGVHQLSIPDGGARTGRFVGRTALYTADGSRFLFSDQRGVAVLSNDGVLLRQISYPAGGSCEVNSWWSSQVALGTCSSKLVRIDIGTGRVTELAKGTPPEYGYFAGWRFSKGILAQQNASCGFGGLDTIDSAGTAHPYHFRRPSGVSGQARLLGVYADQALLATGVCGTPSRSLFSVDLRTGVSTALLGPGVNGGTILN